MFVIMDVDMVLLLKQRKGLVRGGGLWAFPVLLFLACRIGRLLLGGVGLYWLIHAWRNAIHAHDFVRMNLFRLFLYVGLRAGLCV